MTIAEFIKSLEAYPPEMEVLVENHGFPTVYEWGWPPVLMPVPIGEVDARLRARFPDGAVMICADGEWEVTKLEDH